MKVSLAKFTEKVRALLSESGAPGREVDFMLELILDKELTGNRFAGLDELDNFIKQLKESKDKKWSFAVDLPACKLVDGHGRSAILIAMELIDALCEMARLQGIAFIGIYNSTYHAALGTYARKIAEKGMLAIVAANGGPQGVVPHGGKKDVFGTNPLAYGIPTQEAPIVFDAATAKYAYGTIRQAKNNPHLKLEPHTYFDTEGNYTTDPHKAISLIPFGEYKGYAINMLLEVMTGTLLRGKSGLAQSKESELGSFLLALDPSKFNPIEQFRGEVSRLAHETRKVPPLNPKVPVRVPGDRANNLRSQTLKTGFIDVPEETAIFLKLS